MSLFPADEPRPVKCRAGCGRLLTDPESIRLGFGPCCARRLGLTRPTRSRIRTRAGGTSPDQLDLLEEPVTPELTGPDHLALAELDENAKDTRTEYAVIYAWRGDTIASGPYRHRNTAEEAAKARRGLLVERHVQVTYDSWTVAEKGADRG